MDFVKYEKIKKKSSLILVTLDKKKKKRKEMMNVFYLSSGTYRELYYTYKDQRLLQSKTTPLLLTPDESKEKGPGWGGGV